MPDIKAVDVLDWDQFVEQLPHLISREHFWPHAVGMKRSAQVVGKLP
jgi:hypothetical protein